MAALPTEWLRVMIEEVTRKRLERESDGAEQARRAASTARVASVPSSGRPLP
jgi:hypothetical protein